MRRLVTLILVSAVFASLCHAEPRWCSVTDLGPRDTFTYPPIARAARISGIVLMRIVYMPNGIAIRLEPISGSRLLSDSLAAQLKSWRIKTDAAGDELCQTLVVGEFRLNSDGPDPPTWRIKYEVGSVVQLKVDAEPYTIDTVISDPAPLRGFKLFRMEVMWKTKHAFAKVFNLH